MNGPSSYANVAEMTETDSTALRIMNSTSRSTLAAALSSSVEKTTLTVQIGMAVSPYIYNEWNRCSTLTGIVLYINHLTGANQVNGVDPSHCLRTVLLVAAVDKTYDIW